MAELQTRVFRTTIRAPIETVWSQLVQADKPLPHFFGSVMHRTGMKPGDQIRMRTSNQKYTGVIGEILEVRAPYLFSHTFRFTELDDPPCKVTYELKESDAGVEFTLTVEALAKGTKTEKYMMQGGPLIVNTLKSVAETGRPHFKARLILLIIRLTEWMTPARCRSHHWPLEGGSEVKPGGDVS